MRQVLAFTAMALAVTVTGILVTLIMPQGMGVVAEGFTAEDYEGRAEALYLAETRTEANEVCEPGEAFY